MAKRNLWEWLFGSRFASGGIAPPTTQAPMLDRPGETIIPKAVADRILPKVPPVDRSSRTLTNGAPVPEDDSHIQDRGDGQQKGYIVLSDAERAKGFVRPVRDSYVHVGPPKPVGLRDLTPEELQRYGGFGYAKFEPNPDYPATSSITGTFWTQERLDRVGLCGTRTIMGRALAETYARDPSFYGGTFCCGCGAHFPVGARGEFVWDGTDERVGT